VGYFGLNNRWQFPCTLLSAFDHFLLLAGTALILNHEIHENDLYGKSCPSNFDLRLRHKIMSKPPNVYLSPVRLRKRINSLYSRAWIKMGIELATYSRELKRNEHDADSRSPFINPVGASRSPQPNETALDRALDALVAENQQRERQIISLPARLSDLVSYLGSLRSWQRRVVLGTWEYEEVYVNLDHAVEIQGQHLFQGNVDIHECILSETGDWECFSSCAGYCVGCIEGTGTALLFVDREDRPREWLLWTPVGAVQETWKGMDVENGSRGRFFEVGQDFNIGLLAACDGWVELLDD
jgi:hypothetical protein